ISDLCARRSNRRDFSTYPAKIGAREPGYLQVTPLLDAEKAIGLIRSWIEDCKDSRQPTGLWAHLSCEFIVSRTATAEVSAETQTKPAH
ncbi:hypothetical protein LZ189_23300, partial [Rhodovulum sulfidophilum]|nr:hypothetical protein [Rhodovulum sulfidophilum]